MKRSLLLLFLLVAGTEAIKAQTTGPQLVKVTPPSPNVQAMQRYGDIPVSPYTGVPNISIPLYTIKFRDITVPISLSYHASGIKVADEASQTGLGWVLNAAGSISRKVIGDDDFNGGTYFDTNIMDFSNGQFPSLALQAGCTPQFINSNIPNQPTVYNLDLTSYLNTTPAKDFQPDQFYYNFQDHNGKFVVKRTGEVVLEKQEKIQISFSNGGTSWQIKSVDGYTYDFTQYETYNDNQTNRTVVSAWHLTKITSPTGNTVVFNYTTLPTRFITSVGYYSETRDDQDLLVAGSTGGTPTNYGYKHGPTPGQNYTLTLLSSIDFTDGVVAFNYSDDRLDLPGDKRLDSVSVYLKDSQGGIAATPLKTYALSYDYFNGSADPDFSTGAGNASQRLKLLQVQEKGYINNVPTPAPPYILTYYEGSSYTTLPAKTSFARDNWGYYNGVTNTNTLIPSTIPVNSAFNVTAALGLTGPERDVDTNYIKAFSLKTIQYPTGGSTELQYEAHDFDEQKSQINDNSFFRNYYDVVQRSVDGTYDAVAKQMVGSNVLDISNEYSGTTDGGVTQVTLNAVFRFSSGNCSTIQFYTDHLIYFDLYDSTGTNLIQHVDLADLPACSGGNTTACALCVSNSPVFTYTNTLTLPPGRYIWTAHCASTNYAANLQDIFLTMKYYVLTTAQPPSSGPHNANYFYAGGLRVKRIIDHDAINPANDKIKKFVYHYFAIDPKIGQLSEYSYGRRMARPGYAYFDVSLDIYGCDLPSCASGIPIAQANYAHLMRSSESNNPLNGSAGGSVVGYDQVTELYGENGENGQTVFQYYNDPDIVMDYRQVQLPSRPPFASNIPDFMNGSLLQQTDYKNMAGQFTPVRQVTNTYTTAPENENKVFALEKRGYVINYYNDGRPTTGLPPTNCDILLYFYTTLRSEWTYLATTDEKLYDQNDTSKYAETQTSYSYNNPNHLLPTRVTVTNSKGEVVTTHTQYPLDFTNLSATDAFTRGVQNLQNYHVINAPVERYVQKSNGNGSVTTAAILTSYKSSSPQADTVFQLQTPAPLANFNPTSTGSGGVSKNASYQSILSFDTYDANGNILQQHKVNDIYHSYIWDYHNELPVAEVSNTTVDQVAYTSFEADGTGGWSIGSTLRDTIQGFTGNRSYNLSNGAITKGSLTSSRTYIVSYWTRNASAFSITGTIGGFPVKGKTINGWTLYVHKVTGQSTIAINGSGSIDELRLYPSDAQMTTYTYTPLVGMTSQCDVGNRVTYYEYDGLQRLKRIRDQDQNIVKTFDYQYQSGGCGLNCYRITLQTLAGTSTPGYPVGVFNVHGKLLGNTTGASQYVNVWNLDTADSRIGTLSTGVDSLHFNMTLNAGMTMPAGVTGCRYYQVDLSWNKLDAVRSNNAAYVDFGDGTGMRLAATLSDSVTILAPNTTQTRPAWDIHTWFFVHTYPDTSLKTLTFYHNDAAEITVFDNLVNPATSLSYLKNLRGNLPQYTQALQGNSYQQSSMLSVAGVTNWPSIHSITSWAMSSGDGGITPCLHLGYQQDFMAGNPGLLMITTFYSYTGYFDSTFKISRLKSDWNTYFTHLQALTISDAHWNREDLTGLKELNHFSISPALQNYSNNPTGNPQIPIPAGVVDTIFIQIAAGAGQTVTNGTVFIYSGGSGRTTSSDTAVGALLAKGWILFLDGQRIAAP